MTNFFKSHTFSLIIRLLAIYTTLLVLKIAFILYNTNQIEAISTAEISNLFAGSLIFDTANICYTFGLFILLSLLPLSPRALNSKPYKTSLFITYIIGVIAITTLNTLDSVYFHFAHKRLSAEEFHFLDNSNTTTIMMKSMWENITLVILCLSLIVGLIYLFRITRIKYSGRQPILVRKWTYYTFKVLILITSIGLMIIGIRGGIGRDVRPITMSNAATYATSPAKASIILSNPFCILRTMNTPQQVVHNFFDETSAKQYFTPLHQPIHNATFGSQRKKNLVVIILESFSADNSKFLYPDLYDTSLMPFVDSLMSVSYTFTKACANGGKSIEAIPAILSSIPSLETSFVKLPSSLSPVDGIGHFFAKQGYDTYFYNGSPAGSMGFDASAKLSGIEHTRSMQDYESTRGKNDYDGYWGIWDKEFLDYFADELNNSRQPFFSTIFTISSHHPFIVPKEYKDQLPSGTTKIHKSIAYADLSLRHFMKKASSMPWFQNTVFLFVADHVSSETPPGKEYTPLVNSHITYFIYTPDNSLSGINPNITQHIDIKPTIYHLFGNEEPYHAFGRNVMADTTHPFAINFFGGMYQWMTTEKTHLLSIDDIKSTPADDNEMNKLKAFLQSYTKAINNANFKYPSE